MKEENNRHILRKKRPRFDDVFGRAIYCNRCGHFLGYENVIQGAVAFYCRYCKDFIKIISEVEEQDVAP